MGSSNWEGAKTLCSEYRGGGYSDWYLPSKDELNLVYINLRRTGKISGNDWFWSSSEDNNSDHAWEQRFSDGEQDSSNYDIYGHKRANKNNTNSVRAVRAFNY